MVRKHRALCQLCGDAIAYRGGFASQELYVRIIIATVYSQEANATQITAFLRRPNDKAEYISVTELKKVD